MWLKYELEGTKWRHTPSFNRAGLSGELPPGMEPWRVLRGRQEHTDQRRGRAGGREDARLAAVRAY